MNENSPKDKLKKARPGIAAQSQKIVDSSMALYAAHGVDGVSVEDICKAAGVSRHTFYRCFKDKEVLLLEIYSVGITQYVNNANVLSLKGEQGLGALELYVEQGIDQVVEMGDLALTLMQDARRQNSKGKLIVENGKQLIASALVDWANKNYGIRIDPEFFLIISSSIELLLLKLIQNKPITPAKVKKAKASCWKIIFSIFLLEAYQNDLIKLSVLKSQRKESVKETVDLMERLL